MSKKGSASERELATMLSEWWCPGRQDIYWRVLGSGSRAKGRGRKGLDTYGAHGDIMAQDPIGAPLVEVFTIEDKKGYPSTQANPFEEVDRIKLLTPNKQNFAGWIEQVVESSEQAKTPYWWIVFRRSFRKRMVCMPASIMYGSGPFTATDRLTIKIAEACRMTFRVKDGEWYLAFFPLEELLQVLTPKMVEAAARRIRNGR